ncbi:MAG: serine protease [Planctomycetaceae bacterium]
MIEMIPASSSVESDPNDLRPLLAHCAKEWLTFERLRQELQNLDASDPVLISASSRDVEAVVLELLSPKRPAEDVERAHFALIRALSSHPEVAKRCIFDEIDASIEGSTPGALQAMLQARNDIFACWDPFLERMQQVGGQVCQVCIDGKFAGSGFLVSDRHVLTAYHCISPLVEQLTEGMKQEALSSQLKAVFDDIVVPGRPTGPFRSEFAAAKEWLVFNSKEDAREKESEIPLNKLTEGCLDFAVICLEQPAGRSAPKTRRSLLRNWIGLELLANRPAKATQMLIAHFPAGADLRLSVGLFDDHSNCDSRVRYRTPTLMGSSGAPCFTVDWKPYAIHNAAYRKVCLNQGVPLSKVVAAIGGIQSLLRPQIAEAGLLPATTPTEEPILSRQEIAVHVDAINRKKSSEVAIVVTSGSQGGKTYTGELIRTMVIDRGHTAFLFDAEKFAADTPEGFAARLVHEIAGNIRHEPQPSTPDSRQRARWICGRLSDWTRSQIKDFRKRQTGSPQNDGIAPSVSEPDAADPRTKMLWVILDRCDLVKFTQETHDLLVALISGEGLSAEDPLRFLLLGYDGDLGTVPLGRVWKTKLDLISVQGVLPFMRSVLELLSVTEDPEKTRDTANNWVQCANDHGIDIARVVIGLKNWRTRVTTLVTAKRGAEVGENS